VPSAAAAVLLCVIVGITGGDTIMLLDADHQLRRA
jgi:hypothetical protein